MARSYVVMGGGRGLGRAIAERLSADGHVVVVECDPQGAGLDARHSRMTAVTGDAGGETVAGWAATHPIINPFLACDGLPLLAEGRWPAARLRPAQVFELPTLCVSEDRMRPVR